MQLLKLQELDIENKTVFIRCDFNVPMDEYANITDDRRITSALSTIRYCLDRDCKVILASHMGRPKGEPDAKYSLKPVKRRLHSLLHQEIKIAPAVIGDEVKAMAKELKSGEIMLLENLRFEKGEEKNDEVLSRELASLADVFINDAFGVSHRAHASVHGITKFFDNHAKGAGFLLQKEVEFFHNNLENPVRPFAAIVGGSKVSGKLEALKNLLPKVDKLIIGGGMAFTFFKARGYEIGKSLVEEDLVADAKAIIAQAKELGVKMYLPVDIVCADAFSESANVKHTTFKEIPHDYMGLDIGEASMKMFELALKDCKTILWNGPMGVFEMKEFSKGSTYISHVLAKSDAITIIGGGDSADVILRAGDTEAMTFISTGGGASLELIEGKVLPGVEVLRK